MTEPARYQLAYRPDIDGLRALAVAAVVLYHAFPNFLPGGFVGVDIFFVISGYLIASLIWEGLRRETFTIKGFYRRRIVRLFPALVFILAVSAIVGWRILPSSGFSMLKRDIVAAATFSSNFVYWHTANYFTAPAMIQPLNHLWSLAVEEQFYLVWPILLIVFRRHIGWVLAAIFVASFAGNIALIQHPSADFYLLPTRAWELALGGLIAWAQPKIERVILEILGTAAVGLILLSILGPSPQSAYPGWWALAPTAAGSVVILSAGSWFNRLLATRPMVSIGKVSYPLYLWHFPVLVFARDLYPNLSVLATSGLVGACIGLAYFTRWMLELPVHAWNKRRTPVPALVTGMALVASVGFITTTPVVASTKALFTVGQLSSYVYKSNSWRGGHCFLNQGQTPSAFHGCISTGNGPVVVEFGDSHAAQYTYPLARYAKIYGYRLAQFTATSCAPIENYSLRPGCSEINSWDLQKIKELHPYEVILSALWRAYPLPEIQKLQSVITTIKRDGVSHVIIVGNVPTWTTLLPLALYMYSSAHQDKIPRRMSWALNEAVDKPTDFVLQRIARENHVTYVSPLSVLCEAHGCLTRTGNHLDDVTAFDWEHLTDQGANYVVTRLLPQFLPGIAN